MNHPEYTIRLRCQHDPTDPDGIRRLRAALKRLLRGYGLRCLECRPTVPPDLDSTGEKAPESPPVAFRP